MTFAKRNTRSLIVMASAAVLLSRPLASATSLSVHHEATVQFNFGNQLAPYWSGDALVTVLSNQTAAPSIVAFDDNGKQLEPVVFTIPGSKVIDINGWGHGDDGTTLVCGQAFDESGRGSGFFSTIDPNRQDANTTRVFPFTPFRCALAPDRSVWVVGLEMIGGRERVSGVDLSHGVLRHYDAAGHQLGSFIPRNSISDQSMITWGHLAVGRNAVAWHTGPVTGSKSSIFEISTLGDQLPVPKLALGSNEEVTGLAVREGGSIVVSTADTHSKTWRLLQLEPETAQWMSVNLPTALSSATWLRLYGGSGDRLYIRHGKFGLSVMEPSQEHALK